MQGIVEENALDWLDAIPEFAGNRDGPSQLVVLGTTPLVRRPGSFGDHQVAAATINQPPALPSLIHLVSLRHVFLTISLCDNRYSDFERVSAIF